MERKTLNINRDATQESITQYQLVQYTHHIHFQHQETGACLRASEVKPKLDKFICAYCKKHNYELTDECFVEPDKEQSDKDQADKEQCALNYKIQIYPVKPENKCQYSPNAQRDGYLGNQNKPNEDITKTVFYPDGLILSLIIRNIALNSESKTGRFKTFADLIKHVIPAFFLLNCFGARSTKGYGSYAICGKQLWNYRNSKDSVIAYSYLREFIDTYYVIEFPRNIKKSDLPKKAIIISNLMKSGYNLTSIKPKDGKPEDYYKQDYYKGRIFRYFTEAEMGGDKAFIKQKVLNAKKDWNRKSEDYKRYKEYRFVRAMLGFGKEISFARGARREQTAVIVDAIGCNKNKSDATEIIRFNNPVHFVPNGQYLLIIPTDIPRIMSNRRFRIYEKENASNYAEIMTPELVSAGEQNLGEGKFNLEDFLDMFMDDFNNQTDFRRDNGRFKSPIDQLFRIDNRFCELTMVKAGGNNG